MSATTTREVELHDTMTGVIVRIIWPADENEEPTVRFVGLQGRGVPASLIELAHSVLRDPAQIDEREVRVG